MLNVSCRAHGHNPPLGALARCSIAIPWRACVYPLVWLGHDCCGCEPRLTGWQVWPQMVHMSWCSGLALSSGSWFGGSLVPSSAIFQVGWALSLWSCSCLVGVLVPGTDPTGGVRWEPLWRSQLGWANWMGLFLRGTPGVSKVDREWPKRHWPIPGQWGGRSLILGEKKKKKVPALFPENILPDPSPLAHNLNLVMILPLIWPT